MAMYSSMVKMLHASVIVAFSLSISVSAAAIDSSDSPASSQLSSSSFSSSTPSSPKHDRVLGADDMILFGREGRVEVVPQADYMAYMGGIGLATEEQHPMNITVEDDKESASKINKRCRSQTVFTMNPIERYISWDISLSGVVRAPPNSSTSIGVGPGYWISNSLGVSVPLALDLVKEFLSGNLGFNYGQSWTSSYSTGYSFNIPAGKYAAVVSNPVATRFSGYVDKGCIGSSKRIEFSGETFNSKSNSGLTWVDGIIRLCVGNTYPLPRCFGSGTL